MDTRRTCVAACLAAASALTVGCSDDGDTLLLSGVSSSDFVALNDYLDSPVVQSLLAAMPRYQGFTPPNPAGSYDSQGTVTASTFTAIGAAVSSSFCFGSPAGNQLVVRIIDPTVQDTGASSFIEGSGDLFTVYTAFKSVRPDCQGKTCETHQVNIFSGRRNANGSLSDLWIGVGVVGVLGSCCGALVPGDIQVSRNTAVRTGDSCSPDTGGPVDPTKVLAVIENNLVVDLLAFIGTETQPRAIVAPLDVGTFEAPPGFSLYFESLQPSAGQDGQGNELLMGEILSGIFPVDLTPAGDSVTYSIENQVGTDIYFAPLPLNQTAGDIFSVVNLGMPIPGYPPPPGTGLDCLCSMSPDPSPYVVGYYTYAAPGILLPSQANVYFYFVDDPNVAIATFFGPFALDDLSGTVVLLVD